MDNVSWLWCNKSEVLTTAPQHQNCICVAPVRLCPHFGTLLFRSAVLFCEMPLLGNRPYLLVRTELTTWRLCLYLLNYMGLKTITWIREKTDIGIPFHGELWWKINYFMYAVELNIENKDKIQRARWYSVQIAWLTLLTLAVVVAEYLFPDTVAYIVSGKTQNF
jgi:hypothetical protein